MATVFRRHPVDLPAILRALVASPGGASILLCLVALAARAVQFGNPAVQVDDQFYLLVGDRMWQGALPYVDIWDRKPIGLFLIYAAIRGLGGGGIIQYQIVATAFAAGTAITIQRIAGRIASPLGAVAAGVLYLTSLGMCGGEAGQSPVFYNLLVAQAVLATIRVVERPGLDARGMADSVLAMLLMGLALQVKYTVLFEGAYLGLVLAWKAQRGGTGPYRLAALMAFWMALGIAPTAIAWAAYAAIGHGGDFFFANFTSIFGRGHEPSTQTLGRLVTMAAKLLPLGYAGAAGLRPAPDPPAEPASTPILVRRIVAGWAIVAIAGVGIFGDYFDHYALPLLVPLAVATAPVLGDPSAGVAVVARGRTHLIPAAVALPLLTGVVTVTTIGKNRHARGVGEQVQEMADFIRSRLTGCLFVYDGEPILYHLTGSCLPTRWPFPDHLNNRIEDGAIGVDPLAETRRIMAGRPALVVSSDEPERKMNWRTWNYMQAVLARDYRPAASWKIGIRYRVIYERLPGH
ncbi:hypothetical protein GCM10009087_15060 [Sphingomonas oligophenolica]|uniref:Glycosyltransferase RgtA/B/C/D-like domain-containing protein n=1 Tax=Sphingomonas oligophenolica TaxID=301154 RepID=A0ABU9Y2Y7_9SPHN